MKKLFFAALLLCFTLPALADKVVVKNAKEFIEALASNRTVIIDSKAPLVLTPVLDEMIAKGNVMERDIYSRDYTPGVCYYSNYDGNGLLVVGYENLTIKSKEGVATLLSKPRYCDVMTFFDCDDLTLEDVVMGHTDEGYCDRGVLGLKDCDGVNIKECDFFGCGTEGFIFDNCSRVKVEESNVHDCTYHTMHISQCDHILFKDCRFHDNKEFSQINVSESNDIVFEECKFENLQGPLFDLSSKIELNGCSFSVCDLDNVRNAKFDDKCVFADGNAPEIVTRNYDLAGIWTDGLFQYDVKMPNPTTAVFSNELVGKFQITQQDEDQWMTGPVPGESFSIFEAKYYEDHEGDLKEFVIFDDGHSVQDCYRKINTDEYPQDYLLPFYGDFMDHSGRPASLTASSIKLPDFEGTYTVRWMYEAPTQVIDVTPAKGFGKNLRSFFLKLTDDGIDLYEPIFDEDNCTPGRLLYRLDYDYTAGETPRWMELMKDHILSHATFMFVPKNLLPLMRNLPYALQGYSFGKANLKNYFESQIWYSANPNSQIYLSRIEEFNCALIKFIERFELDQH